MKVDGNLSEIHIFHTDRCLLYTSVMPVINKIDLPSAQPDEVVKEIEDVIGIEAEDAPRISAKRCV